jgi:hypothetical protein
MNQYLKKNLEFMENNLKNFQEKKEKEEANKKTYVENSNFSLKERVCLEPKSLEFQTFNCPELGVISPRACDFCRIRLEGNCPLGKGA